MQGLSPFRSRFFWNLYATIAAVLAATALLTGILVDQRVGRTLRADFEASLRDQCLALEPYVASRIEEGDFTGLQARIDALGNESGNRLTVILADGRVMADSDEDPSLMENHAMRPEVLAARDQGFGIVERFSHTVRREMLDVARALREEEGLLGFVRVAAPLHRVIDKQRGARDSIVVGAGVGLLVALLLGLLVARRWTAPIVAMTEVAAAMSSGRYESRVQVRGGGELAVLGTTLNRLGGELSERIASISEDDAQLRAMLAGMVEGVVAVDEGDHVTFCNGAAVRLLGIEEEAPVGRKLWELVAIAELGLLLDEARSSSSLSRKEIELFRGRERVLDVHASPYQGGGRTGLVLVLHDTTELRRLERIRRDFVANVSHELKTPLTSIKGFVETLLAGALHDERNNMGFLRRIDANVERLTTLVSDLLSLARIEAAEGRVELAPVDWRAVVDDVLRRHEDGLAKKQLACEVLGLERPLVVLGNREALTQVLDNLVDNAIKYTPGSGRIGVELSATAEHGVLSVEDTGVGIPAADLDRIFERFYRVDKARSRELGGTGLGLSIVKHLVLSMRGEVRVESTLGKGTRFTVEIPLADRDGGAR